MIGLDTNVIVRMITRDDPVQTAIAERLLDAAEDDSLYVSHVVLAELAWVLNRAYKFPRSSVLDAVEMVLSGREFCVEQRSIAMEAVARARQAGCNYADALIELSHKRAGTTGTLTFDIAAKRLPDMLDAMAYK